MKLLQCNVNGLNHVSRILSFIAEHSPDVLCLQEVQPPFIDELAALGYQTTFLPNIIKLVDGLEVTEGVALASKHLVSARRKYYHQPNDKIVLQNAACYHDTTSLGYIIGDCIIDEETFTIATTHFTWTPRGDVACTHQKEDMEELLTSLKGESAHLLCGDFNIPRHQNELYKSLKQCYRDDIPPHYTSSLDKEFHRLGGVLSRNYLFTHFMVDYIFSKPPYFVSDVSLHFGVSDHAAVLATVSIAESLTEIDNSYSPSNTSLETIKQATGTCK